MLLWIEAEGELASETSDTVEVAGRLGRSGKADTQILNNQVEN